MNHRKTHSQGYIPFSWEEKPGISKFNHQKSSSADMGSLLSPRPPPCTLQPPTISYQGRSLRSKDDPFLAALKSCTKNVSSHRGYEQVRQQRKHEKVIRSFSVFSCKKSCDVLESDNLVKFSKLPPIPKERYSAKSFVTRD